MFAGDPISSSLPGDVVQDRRLGLDEGVIDLVSVFIDDSDPGAFRAVGGYTHFAIESKYTRLVLGPRAPLGRHESGQVIIVRVFAHVVSIRLAALGRHGTVAAHVVVLDCCAVCGKKT